MSVARGTGFEDARRALVTMAAAAALAACATSPAATTAGGVTGTAAGRRAGADTAGAQAPNKGVGQIVPGDSRAGLAASDAAVAAVGKGGMDAGTRLAATATSDAQIVGLLHESNLGEVAAGQLAQQKAQDAGVKSFAQQMVTDHTALDARGNALATQAGIAAALPDSTLPRGDAQAMTALQGAGSGAAFDRAYIAQQVGAHQRTLALVDASIGKAQNAQLKTMLQSEVRPRIADHLQRAQDLQRTVGTSP